MGILMAKKTKTIRTKVSEVLGRSAWPIIAVVSLILNAALISTWVYLLNYRQIALANYELPYRCAEPGYSRMMSQINTGGKQFAAAALCFTDYNTGKPLDIASLKPKIDSQSILPAHP